MYVVKQHSMLLGAGWEYNNFFLIVLKRNIAHDIFY